MKWEEPFLTHRMWCEDRLWHTVFECRHSCRNKECCINPQSVMKCQCTAQDVLCTRPWYKHDRSTLTQMSYIEWVCHWVYQVGRADLLLFIWDRSTTPFRGLSDKLCCPRSVPLWCNSNCSYHTRSLQFHIFTQSFLKNVISQNNRIKGWLTLLASNGRISSLISECRLKGLTVVKKNQKNQKTIQLLTTNNQ